MSNENTTSAPTKGEESAPAQPKGETTEQRLTAENEQLKTKQTRALNAIHNGQLNHAIDILTP